MRSKLTLLWLAVVMVMVSGCRAAIRHAAPPELIGMAAPDGFPSSVRLVTTDLHAFTALARAFFGGIRAAATDGTVDIPALSG